MLLTQFVIKEDEQYMFASLEDFAKWFQGEDWPVLLNEYEFNGEPEREFDIIVDILYHDYNNIWDVDIVTKEENDAEYFFVTKYKFSTLIDCKV